MSDTFAKIADLVEAGEVRVSVHGYRRLVGKGISVPDLVTGIRQAQVIEDYPNYHAGPAVLVLCFDATGGPLHAVWGIEKNTKRPAVLVTAYRPIPARWSADFRRRKP